jgi:hypothetical protein
VPASIEAADKFTHYITEFLNLAPLLDGNQHSRFTRGIALDRLYVNISAIFNLADDPPIRTQAYIQERTCRIANFARFPALDV